MVGDELEERGRESGVGTLNLGSPVIQQASPCLFIQQLKFLRRRLEVPKTFKFCPVSEVGQCQFHLVLLAKTTQRPFQSQ